MQQAEPHYVPMQEFTVKGWLFSNEMRTEGSGRVCHAMARFSRYAGQPLNFSLHTHSFSPLSFSVRLRSLADHRDSRLRAGKCKSFWERAMSFGTEQCHFLCNEKSNKIFFASLQLREDSPPALLALFLSSAKLSNQTQEHPRITIVPLCMHNGEKGTDILV